MSEVVSRPTYKQRLVECIRGVFCERTYTPQFFYVLRHEWPKMLSEEDVRNLSQKVQSPNLGSREILDVLIVHDNWFDCIIEILSQDRLRESDLAKELLTIKDNLDERMRHEREINLFHPASSVTESLPEIVVIHDFENQDNEQAQSLPMPNRIEAPPEIPEVQRAEDQENACPSCSSVVTRVRQAGGPYEPGRCLAMYSSVENTVLNAGYLRTQESNFSAFSSDSNRAMFRLACMVYRKWANQFGRVVRDLEVPECVLDRIGTLFPCRRRRRHNRRI